MLRFILWSLLFYGIYRLIWPRQRNVSSTGSGHGAAGYDAQPGAKGAASKNASANAGSGHVNSKQPYTRAAEEVGEYIEYEEVR